MIPTIFAQLDALPRTPHGKIDRSALPDPEPTRIPSARGAEGPRNAIETTLAELVATLLNVPQIGIHDDFFELGIDSISAIQLAARARQAGLSVAPAEFFEFPTVAGLAAVATQTPAAAEESRNGAAGHAEGSYPLTPLQEGMLLYSRYFPESGAYIQQLDSLIRGALDVSSLHRAWERLAERHAILRTSFVRTDHGPPRQVEAERVPSPWEVVDWRGVDPAEQERRLLAFLRDDRLRGFDSAAPALSRVHLFLLGHGESRLVWTYHHVLVDGWSLQIVLRDLLALYEAEVTGRAVALAPAVPFRRYTDWLSSQDSSRAEPFWRDVLRGFRRPTPLAIDRPGLSDEADEPWDEQELRLSSEATEALAALGRTRGLTLSTIVHGAWAILLARYAGIDDVVFGTTVSGRSAPIEGVEQLVGPLINTLPVRIRVDGRDPVASWLARAQSSMAAARQFEATPLVKIRTWSEVPRERPLFETLVVFENYPVDATLEARALGLGLGPSRVFEHTEYALTLMAFPGRLLTLRLTYDAHRFDAQAIDGLLGHLNVLLEELPRDPERVLDDLPLVAADEVRRTLDQWSSPESRREALVDAAAAADLVVDHELERLSDLEVESLIGEFINAEEVRDD
jgi:aryl carrier-like protein